MEENKKLGVIVPYRNREEHLKVFLKKTTKYLNARKIDYEIIVVHQDDAKLFNRGMLLNIGFKIAESYECDYVVFHDVDMIPLIVDYSYSDIPLHLATDFITKNGEKKREMFDQYFGGVTMITMEDFEKINGYSNKYWGWGYEDDDLLVIDKPAGIIMHPGAGNYDETIVNALMHYNKDSLSTIGDELRPGIVHRIDKDTSGLIVIAKNNETHENLSHQFSEHTITRVYQLLIWGKLRPSSGKIDTFITRSSKNRQMMEVSNSKGKRAITNYKTIEIFENDKTPTLSLVECRLETGRTHQIRVHMTHMGNSIMGDGKYKKKYKKLKNIDTNLENLIYKLDRQFLHAQTLGFIHPRTNEEMVFTSILPQELENILVLLRNTGK